MKWKLVIIGGTVVITFIAVGFAAIFLGAYNFGADSPHTRLMVDLIEYARDRSVAVRTGGIKVPNLSDPKLIAEGANDYSKMCTGCHLAPGMAENEMRPGMYPKPPVLAAQEIDDPAVQFWIVKHGIKMSGMPAWGVTQPDPEIWAIVAFLQKLPSLTPAQYGAMTTSVTEHHVRKM